VLSARAALTTLLSDTGLSFARVTDDLVTIVSSQGAFAPPPSLPAQDPKNTTDRTFQPAPQVEDGRARDSRAEAAVRIEEVVVTGSRIRSTFNSSTPVTVTSAEDLRQSAPNNLADALNQLPAFTPSTRTEVTITSATAGTNGQNLLNLRNLGTNRNLILLDGRRLPATNPGGSVDVNVMPQGLVRRVDVVTGGASAVYGSDAVSGVVNFILDTKFEGARGEIGTGVSGHGDLPSGHGNFAFGRAFAGDRAHVIASAEVFGEQGIGAKESSHRDWFENAAGQIPNPVAGANPALLVIPNIRSSLGTAGGLIAAGPLKGIQFLPGGAPAPFDYGAVTGSAFQSGGDGARVNIAFAPEQARANTFIHGELEIGEDAALFAEVHYAYTHVASDNQINPQTGTGNQFTIFAGNAYLPAAITAAMAAADVTAFPLGRYEADFPAVQIDALLRMKRFVGGIKGEYGEWTYDASFTHGVARQEVAERNLTINRRLYAAADAVVNPATGLMVCRSTLVGLDPGCVPLNLFGQGAPRAAAIRYVTGDAIQYLTIQQDVAALNVSGDIGMIPGFAAGPVSLAAGVEYRRESANSVVDPLSPLITDFDGVRGGPASQQGRPGSFNFYNPSPLHGQYGIAEGYLEFGIPLLKDHPLAKLMDIDVAVRTAQYSQSGNAITWKAGFNSLITDEYRLRFTASRDIRGPNILELFNAATQNSNNQIYQGKTTPALTISSGNPDLRPERALTTTFGGVYRPGWLPGFQLSADYYNISISGAIGALTAQNTLDSCTQGNAFACAQVTVTSAGTLVIRTAQMNLSVAKVSGLDFESAYGAEVWNGRLGVRLLANHTIQDYTRAPGALAVPRRGTATSPDWRSNLQVSFSRDQWTAFLQERFISRALFDPAKVEGVDTNLNHAPAVWYTEFSASYRIGTMGGTQDVYLSVANLFDRDPPINTNNPTTFSQPTNAVYDKVGRYFSAGVRFRF
jgi:iron complex outermembrane receptor protein